MVNDALTVNRLRVQCAPENGLAVRLRLAHLLNTADLQPAGLPPSAVLVVKHLADPLPGRLAPTRRAVRVDAAWERAARRALDELYRRAARPVRGVILGEPDAVLFADAAELLACRLLAQQRGRAPAWWQQGAPAGQKTKTADLLRQRPILVPAVLHHLAEWDTAVAVAASLAAREALDLLHAVAEAHQLPALALLPESGWSSPIQTSAEAELHPRPERRQSDEEMPPAGGPATVVASPWVQWLPNRTSMILRREQAALLGVCLALHARPNTVRTPAFRHAVQQWWGAREATPLSPRRRISHTITPGRSEDVAEAHPTDDEAAAISAAPPSEALNGAPPAPEPETTTLTSAGDDLMPLAADGAGVAEPGRTYNSYSHCKIDPTSDTSPTEPRSTPDSVATSRSVADAPPARPDLDAEPDPSFAVEGTAEPPVKAQETPVASSFPDTTGVATGAGGVLYLLNLMRVLNLPDACERGWGLAGQVGAWGVLELLGRALLGPAGAAHAADPLWQVLAELDGRLPQTLPGVAYEMRGDGSLPVGWEAMAGDWSPQESPLLAGVNDDLRRWSALAIPFLRRRLRRALHLANPAELPGLLLVPGRLFVTRSHVDLVMDLEAIALPVRRAGLDANPGWLPAFGRIVTFHFR